MAWDGVACTGSHPVLIKLGKHGAVDQVDASTASDAYCTFLGEWQADARADLCVSSLLVACCEGGRPMRGAYFQLAWALASHLELALKSKANGMTNHAKLRPGKKSRVSPLAHAQAKHFAESRDRRLHQYHHACHAAFSQQQFLGLTLDFSRVGHHKTGLACLSSLDNVLAWCPPQAARAKRCATHTPRKCYSCSLGQ